MKTKKIVFAALIGAVYAALSYFLAPISFGLVQVRVSEALTVLPYFSSLSVIGLFIGCLVSNLASPFGPIDIIFGSGATLIAAFITYLIGKSNIKFKKWLAPLPAVIVNGIVVGTLIYISMTKTPATASKITLLSSILLITIEEIIPCYLIGIPIITAIEKNPKIQSYLK